MVSAVAPGKVILVGEHAVVYGRPAIAAPVWQVMATATVTERAHGSGFQIVAPDIGETILLEEADPGQPLALVTRLALAQMGYVHAPDWLVEVHSTIPIASGLGSGAALSTALVRALYAQTGTQATPGAVSSIVYESERIYHGTPSGIDNTVIAYGEPIWFVKGRSPESFAPPAPFTLVIADSGIRSPTKETVGDVRLGWQSDPKRYEAWFDEIADVVRAARTAIESAAWDELGRLMDANQQLLAALGVSSDPLERMILAARQAGALGAKLSGGGRGGNVITLVTPDLINSVQSALLQSGAASVLATQIAPHTLTPTKYGD